MLVVTEQDVETLLEFINANEVLAYDTETTGLNVRKDTIMGFGISNSTSGFYVPLFKYSLTRNSILPYGPGPGLIASILGALSRKKLLMFNASFDGRFTLNNLGVDLIPALYADVLLMKHTCDEEYPFALKEIAAKLWGHDVKKEKSEMQESVKANNGTAKQYYKADTHLLAKYCIQDCLLTFKIYNHYIRDLRAQGLEKFYFEDEVLPLYKEVTIPMESLGVRIDIERAKEVQLEISIAISKLECQIQESIIPKLGAVFAPWFLNKDYPLITYKGNTTLLGRRFAESGQSEALKYQEEQWRKDSETPYMFNLQSKHHLKKLFFDTLSETPLSRTPTGQPQVDEEFLTKMSEKYDWCSKLIEFNKLNKLKGTYIDRFVEETEDGIYYPSFMQHGTVSGRYSGDMQQLPRPLEAAEASEAIVYFTNLIREFVIPRSGNRLASADYEQLEPTIFSHTSGDAALQEIFNEGTDFYSTVAIRTESLTGVSAVKSSANYLGKSDKAARQKAKAYALGIAYGMTGYKLKFEINCSEEEADKLVKDYLAAFPALERWMYDSRDYVKRNGVIKTQTGRVRHMPAAKALFEEYGTCIENDLELWKRYNQVPVVYERAKAARRKYKNLLNNAINFQVQGLAASILNRAAILLARRGLVPIMQVHDELVYDIPESQLEASCALIQTIMQDKVMKLSVPLRTTPQTGTNYRQCK